MLATATQRGFSLIETAIVLVIVTLLMGGVLRGQELVTQARIRDVMNDLSGVTAAYQFYFDRYKALPGDDLNAGPRWTPFNAKSGGGDGRVSGKYMDPPPFDPTAGGFTVDNNQHESLNFWWHLRIAGFVAGPATGPGAASQPSNASGGILGVQVSGLDLTGLIACESNVPQRIAGAVDNQLDDQLPGSGQVRGYRQSVGNEDVTGKSPNASAYGEEGTQAFVVCKRL